jgi:signal transduction histidine kinase
MHTRSQTHSDEGNQPPKSWLVRSRDDRVIAGVAGGLGKHFGLDAIILRIAFVALAAAGGAGVLIYLFLWAISAEPGSSPVLPLQGRATRRSLGIAFIVLGSLTLLRQAGVWFGDAFVWPLALAAIGFAISWARSEDEGGSRWTRITSRIPGSPMESVFGGRTSALRLAMGGLLIATGLGVFLAANNSFATAGNVLLAVIVTAAGLSLVIGPWVWRLAQQLTEERRERIRSQERAEVAAHLHDSVLQTLALIQHSNAPREAASLARSQERELRAWLYGRGPASDGNRLSTAIDEMAGRIEQLQHVTIEAIVVGDSSLDDRVRAMVKACGEATLNAARHSGVDEISVYVEVEKERITAFVRDQGSGFSLDSVPPDRRGLSDSIIGRMHRNGGSATIISEPGSGTEVQLQLPRDHS